MKGGVIREDGAMSDERAPRRRGGLALERAIDNRRLEAGRIIDEPAQIRASQRIVDSRRQLCLREEVREIEKDRDLLGNERVAVLDRRNLSHGIDGKIFGSSLLPRLHVEHVQIVRRTQLLEQNKRPRGSSVRRVIK